MTPHADLAAYSRASRRLLHLIGAERRPFAPRDDRFGRAAARLAQTRALLHELGNPQGDYPIVHVTGTSGKGSVATMIAAVLSSAGYRVGSRTSPYLQVATEKLQMDSRLIDARSLDRISAQVLAVQARSRPGVPLGYPEAWSAMTFLWFAQENVDVAVVEVGAGGRFDSTNVFDPVVSVITGVGLDHTAVLGPTLADIAWHKAGIIKTGSLAVVGALPEEARQVIAREAAAVGATLLPAREAADSMQYPVTMPGAFQRSNAAIATAAIAALANRGFSVEPTHLRSGIASARLPGRLELMPDTNRPAIWLDGAHNPDKMAALTQETRRMTNGGPGAVFVLGMVKSKDAASILAAVAPYAVAIVATEPSIQGRASLPASALAMEVQASGFVGPLIVAPDPVVALNRAESLAVEFETSVVATGSMYLVGHLRRRWYPDDLIVVQRTPWPVKEPSMESG